MPKKAKYAIKYAGIMGLSLSVNFSVSFSGYHAEGSHAPPVSFPATTPRATTPVQMHSS